MRCEGEGVRGMQSNLRGRREGQSERVKARVWLAEGRKRLFFWGGRGGFRLVLRPSPWPPLTPRVCCHGDLHFGNIITVPPTDGSLTPGVVLADFEFVGCRPAVEDLSYLFLNWGDMVTGGAETPDTHSST